MFTLACQISLVGEGCGCYGDGWYGDGAGNTVEENSSVFSLIRMC